METITKKTAVKEKYSHIKDIDADPESEPKYPLKDNNDDDHTSLNYKKPSQLDQNIEVLPPSTPPSGLSGLLRRMALRYSESSFGHWLPLIFADRVNIWEGFLHDFKRAGIPNLFRKRGHKADLRYNKKQFIAKTTVKVLVGAMVFAWLMTSAGRKEKGRSKK